MEELMKVFLLLSFVCCIFIPLASPQPGFLNIACGSKTNYTDERGLKWVADAPYIGNLGQAKAIRGIYFRTYRIFRKPLNRACYTLPVNASKQYWLRLSWEDTLTAVDGDFIAFIQSEGMLFKFHPWIVHSVDYGNCGFVGPYYKEWILTPKTNDLHICYARNGTRGVDPLISGIQLIEVPMDMYQDIMMYQDYPLPLRVHRRDYGNNNSNIRYPDDKFDRIWAHDCSHSHGNIDVNISCSYCAPERVLQTTKTNSMIDFSKADGAIVYVITPTGVAKQMGRHEWVSLSETNDSPSSIEYFYTLSLQQGTNTKDVNALSMLKGSLNLSFKSWIADPCCGSPWERIQCDINEKNVVSLNLSGLQLYGSMPDTIGNLSSLQTLHIESNNFSGPLPNWLTKLENLEELFISYNNFSGQIPTELLHLKTFRHEGNNFTSTNINTSRKANSKSHKNVLYIALPISGICLLLVMVVGLVLRRKGAFKTVVTSNSFHTIPNLTKLRRFNRDEMISTTQNFSSIIGHGGFGSVFHGILHNVGEIAVKVLSASSKQGEQEFLNELDLLSKVNHKNLVRVIGYCNETDQFMIVYEYMCKGSLADHLHGSKSESSDLNWICRLQIALGAAVGLEYLHIHCKPKIIHRDLKSANILLDNNFNGKLSDLGISKALMEEASCITTDVKGTFGYLDPEYLYTHMLTEKSDIYSFGVVLLEIVFGRKPIDTSFPEDLVALCQWVINQNAHGDESQEYIEKFIPFIDNRIRNQVKSMESMMLVIKLAINCIQMKSSFRPSASGVVERLKEAFKQETGEDMHFPQGTEMQYGFTSMNEIVSLEEEDYTLETLTLVR